MGVGLKRRSKSLSRYLIFVAGLLVFCLVVLYYDPNRLSSEGGGEDVGFIGVDSGALLLEEVNEGTTRFVIEAQRLPHEILVDELISKRLTKEIPDTRSRDCRDLTIPPGNIAAKLTTPVTVVLLPSTKSTVVQYELTIASLLSTTDFYYDKLEVVVLEAGERLDDEVIQLVERLSSVKMPTFRLVRVKAQRGDSLFQILLEFIQSTDEVKGDFVVFLKPGMRCNVGWFEGMLSPLIDPLYGRPAQIKEQTPVIVVPHYDNYNEESNRYSPFETFVRMTFSWLLEPQWYQVPFEELLYRYSEAEPIQTPAFLPDSFAIQTSSPLFVDMYEVLKENELLTGATSLDIAHVVYRCLRNAAIVVAPCARIGSPFAYPSQQVHVAFDPIFISDDKSKAQSLFIHRWIDHDTYYKIATVSLGVKEKKRPDLPKSCKNLSAYLKYSAKDVISPKGHLAAGILKTYAGRCFQFTIDHRIVAADSCDIISDNHIFYYDFDGAIRLRNEYCLTKNRNSNYLEAGDCNVDKDPSHQKWVFDNKSMLRLQNATSDSCIMQATDPDPYYKERQILMMDKCREDHNQYFKFEQFSFTYQAVKKGNDGDD